MNSSRNIPAFLENELRSPGDINPHWSSSSQTYAPADALMHCLMEGWTLSPIVGQAEHGLGGGRRVNVYHFELSKENRQIAMKVHSNPVVRRLLRQRTLKIVMIDCDDIPQPEQELVTI